MADIKSVVAAMQFMGGVTTFSVPTGTSYAGVDYKGHKWLLSQRKDQFIFTRDNVYVTVCMGDATPVLTTLKLIADGDLNPNPNPMALQLREAVAKVALQRNTG